MEPLLGHRIAPVRAAIDAAAVVLDKVAAPELRARILLRLAQVKLVQVDFEGADQALNAVGEHVPEHTAMRFLTGVKACRVALRRGPEQRKLAGEMLLHSAAALPQFDADDVIWQRVASEVSLGIAEVALHEQTPDEAAFEPLRQLVDELGSDPAHVDTVFTAQQVLATFAISIGDGIRAVAAMRAVLKIAQGAGSPADEVEARLGLAGLLVTQTQGPAGHVSRDEAARHVQRARDTALEHELTELHHAALIAQAGVLADGGKTAGALDRMLQLARSAAADQDVPRYVAAVGMMAELYARSGDAISAFRTITESHRALSEATKSDATPLFRPHLAALRERIGSERLEQIAADISRANQLAAELEPKSGNDPS